MDPVLEEIFPIYSIIPVQGSANGYVAVVKLDAVSEEFRCDLPSAQDCAANYNRNQNPELGRFYTKMAAELFAKGGPAKPSFVDEIGPDILKTDSYHLAHFKG